MGNSSSGLLEAPAFGTPAVNLGIRQAGRERTGNVVDAPHQALAIERAVRKALGLRIRNPRSPYGDGRTAPRVARLLASIPVTPRLLEKSNA